MSTAQQIIDQTITWIHKVVVGCNFCPFAARTLQQHHVHYQVEARWLNCKKECNLIDVFVLVMGNIAASLTSGGLYWQK